MGDSIALGSLSADLCVSSVGGGQGHAVKSCDLWCDTFVAIAVFHETDSGRLKESVSMQKGRDLTILLPGLTHLTDLSCCGGTPSPACISFGVPKLSSHRYEVSFWTSPEA